MTLEEKLELWKKQGPMCVVTATELQFIADMRKARAAGAGYGWMQQIIEWEWQAHDPVGAWGPEYFERQGRGAAK